MGIPWNWNRWVILWALLFTPPLFAEFSKAKPISLKLHQTQFHIKNESTFIAVLELIENAKPGSTVDLGYYIIEGDYTSSYLIRKMIERARIDKVKFRVLVDYIMSEKEYALFVYMASQSGVEVKRRFPPTEAFKNFLRDELQMKEWESFVRGLCLQDMKLILKGLSSSPLLSMTLAQGQKIWRETRGRSLAKRNLDLVSLLEFLTSPEAIRILPALIQFEAQFVEFSRRFHHKFIFVETSEGLRIDHGGSNWSDEYNLSLETAIGRILLKNRSYPFIDLNMSGLVKDPVSILRLRQSAERLWSEGPEFNERVLPALTSEALLKNDHMEIELNRKASALESHLTEIRAAAKANAFTPLDFNIQYAENLGRSETAITDEWVRHIHQAKEKVVIISAYFLLFNPLLPAIVKAIKRGVKVEIYTNSYATTDMNMVNIGAYHLLDNWLALIPKSKRHLLKVMELDMRGQKGSLHMKGLKVDHRIIALGSANTDPRSHDLDTNNFSFLEINTLAQERVAHEVFSYYLHQFSWVRLTLEKAGLLLNEIRKVKPHYVTLFGCPWFLRQL